MTPGSKSKNPAANIDSLLEGYRGRTEAPTPQEIEKLYTEGCAEALRLEAERLRIGRRLHAANTRGQGAHDAPAASELAHQQVRVEQELDDLRAMLRHLRAAVEWLRKPEPL